MTGRRCAALVLLVLAVTGAVVSGQRLLQLPPWFLSRIWLNVERERVVIDPAYPDRYWVCASPVPIERPTVPMPCVRLGDLRTRATVGVVVR